ncbi:MAG: hypothetical protein E7420_02475 [Ruminococcaceae bacterium]|nr:hypothetical protein [Oscillospiraceae bacterium]
MLPQKKKKHNYFLWRNSSPALIAAITLCAALVFVSLFFRTSLVLISDETIELENKIIELEERRIELKIRHAEVFSLEETERYALEVLGMQRAGVDQIRFVEFANPAEDENVDQKNIKGDFISLIKEYFPG